MKKLVSLFVIALVASTLLSSCVSLTKRHYSKGYFVTRHAYVPQQTSSTTEVKPIQNKQYTEVTGATPSAVTAPADSVYAPMPQPVVTTDAVEPVIPNTVSKPAEKNSLKNQIRVFTNPIKKLKQTISKKGTSAAQNGEGYSLLWIIIVVILILWLIGFLADGFGLGGLIHLLLVIALILFILWLLRVL